MALITPAKQEIDFCLRTTKPFHNRKAAQDFFRLVDTYGPNYRPFKYGNYEPMKQIFNDKEEIKPELREAVVEYFEASVRPEIREALGKGFIFRPFRASDPYDKKKKLVPEFSAREFFGKQLDEKSISKS